MIGQLSLPIITSLAGLAVGALETYFENKRKDKQLQIESNRDMFIAKDGQLEKFYEQLEREDEPKKFSKTTIHKDGSVTEKVWWRFVSIPSRQHRFYVMLLLSFAVSLVVCWCAIDADRIIWSFAAEPTKYAWLNLWGFSLVEGEKNHVYQLTLGGLILPLLSPFFGILSKWVTGTGFNK